MTIRYLIGAALMAGACVAHADVIPAAGMTSAWAAQALAIRAAAMK
jgi:hypothetical protein